ncbi:nidogen-like domain-containing protein [Phaeobacter sp. QD34_3]|uniref:nidogen-like domain-containing protein n=1 Tax=unclassified Phaeobacter TaxID=2621772 RepID=UPI00237F89C3|nr:MULTISPECIES: nidogen-like domain-containing protein [unclassified Phaeobacter]MDE4134763.1 nidogen-like domain-containing protein [Phaeobacter sp. QD34_3]MDE4138421.1 nidogen-like domain-containing protein [Phaeobacter sp. QD34_24]
MAFDDYRSLLVSDTEGWHDGSDVITYSFLGTDMPKYYRRLDTDGDGIKDSWNIGGEIVPFTNDFSMTVEQRAMTSLAIEAWNEVANVNLQPGTIARGGTDSDHGTPVTGDGTLVAAGGDALPVNDDGYSLVDMSAVFEEGLNFFGVDYDASQIYVNTNGNITFGTGLSQYTPSGISAGTIPLIAAFWADVDTRAGEPIYVDVDAEADVVTITWENVGFYSHHAEPSNSFQMQLFDRGEGDFDIVFRYEDINWSAGTASGGDPETGLGGTPARAGYSPGNGADFFELPQSGIESDITNLENITGNTGVEGLWVFEVRNGAIVGDIAFGSTGFEDTGLYGFVADFPNPDHLGDRPSRAGDMWINNANTDQYIPGVGPIYGHTSWNTYLHELGHALGLRHPNERPNDPDTNAQYTVMSYAAHPSEADESLIDQSFSLTPMVWDIQALQELYGANTTTRTTDTVYFGDGGGENGALEYQYATNADNDLGMQVRGQDGNYRDVHLTIWDAGGSDLIDASDLSTRSFIDLRPGRYSTIGEETDNIAVAAAVREGGEVINYIENAWGGSGRDRITGNNADNELLGGGGRDVIRGNRGDDMIEGESGNDKLYGNGGGDLIEGGSGKDRINGGSGGDVLFGDGGNDNLSGGNGNDDLDGGAGNDRLLGGRGADTFIFGTGNDTVRDFNTGQRGEVVDLSDVAAITDFSDLIANHATDVSGGVRISDLGGNTMLLEDLTVSDLAANDFLF